ncbi:metal tolerance protein C4-like isoform X1 [Coffea arabica]|uniref:Metal tolerance protein C4-like isoform X1 n=2 Tax=Coffea arabica TaxID=13443 RepID=A0A6P6XL52_COFAR|nr:metal tolerance protein C4-like isoform X1 [Coffea arabica]
MRTSSSSSHFLSRLCHCRNQPFTSKPYLPILPDIFVSAFRSSLEADKSPLHATHPHPHHHFCSNSNAKFPRADHSHHKHAPPPPPRPRPQQQQLLFSSRQVRYFTTSPRSLFRQISSSSSSPRFLPSSFTSSISFPSNPIPHPCFTFSRGFFTRPKRIKIEVDDHGQRAVTTALWCNFLVFSLKFGVWFATSSHVMLAEVVHSIADFLNQALLAYGLSSSKRAPDAIHPYGYSKERFVWSLISAVGIFCLGSGATIVHGIQNLWTSQSPVHIEYAALVIGGSFLIEGASLLVAVSAVRKGAAAEGMKVRDYIWRGHDPTAVAVMTEDGAAVTGLAIAAASLVAVNTTGNPVYDPIGSIIVGNLLGMVAIFLIQRNRHALIGRAIDNNDMERVLQFLKNDTVVDAVYDCKSEVIGPGFFRFKAEIDFNGVVLVQNYLDRAGREDWARQFREAAEQKDDAALLKIMSNYGEEVVTALGSEVDRLEKEIQEIVPGIKHVDIEAHNPIGPSA